MENSTVTLMCKMNCNNTIPTTLFITLQFPPNYKHNVIISKRSINMTLNETDLIGKVDMEFNIKDSQQYLYLDMTFHDICMTFDDTSRPVILAQCGAMYSHNRSSFARGVSVIYFDSSICRVETTSQTPPTTSSQTPPSPSTLPVATAGKQIANHDSTILHVIFLFRTTERQYCSTSFAGTYIPSRNSNWWDHSMHILLYTKQKKKKK